MLTAVRTEIELEYTALLLVELEVMPSRTDFDPEIMRLEAEVRAGDHAQSGPARSLYRRFGVDPTRHRPSSEALLRRMRGGGSFPRINSLVDIANLMSVRHQVPVGLYDLDVVVGSELVIRLGLEGESYEGIGKGKVNVADRICLVDGVGPCGNPSADSARTRITTETTQAAWVYFLPVSDAVISHTAELVARYGRGLVRVP